MLLAICVYFRSKWIEAMADESQTRAEQNACIKRFSFHLYENLYLINFRLKCPNLLQLNSRTEDTFGA